MFIRSAEARSSRRARVDRLAAPRTFAATLAVVILLLGACGGDGVSETLIEQAIERESGEDIDFDLDGDGGFSFETDEGSFQLNEDGSFTIVGEDGEVITGETNNEGDVTIESEDGTSTFSSDSESGEVTFESEGESGSFKTVAGIPDEWPSDMVLPPLGLVDVMGSVVTGDGQMFISVTGTAPQGAAAYFDTYGGALEGSGHELMNFFEGDGFRQGTYVGPAYSVSLVGDDEMSTIAASLSPN